MHDNHFYGFVLAAGPNWLSRVVCLLCGFAGPSDPGGFEALMCTEVLAFPQGEVTPVTRRQLIFGWNGHFMEHAQHPRLFP